MPKIKDITGQRFGRLVVEKRGRDYISSKGKHQIRWECKCDCGGKALSWGITLRSGLSKSCGCVSRERMREIGRSSRTHGHARHGATSREYATWRRMLRDCYNQNARNYERYGGRGITVCERWKNSFENFISDMNQRPRGMTLDRYPNNDGNYEPGNCRWATPKEQSNNRKNTKNITIDGETKHIMEWARIGKISKITLWFRLKYGWEPKRAVFEPIHRKSNQISNSGIST